MEGGRVKRQLHSATRRGRGAIDNGSVATYTLSRANCWEKLSKLQQGLRFQLQQFLVAGVQEKALVP